MPRNYCKNKIVDEVAEVFADDRDFTKSWTNRFLWLLFVVIFLLVMFFCGFIYNQSKRSCFTDIVKFYLQK